MDLPEDDFQIMLAHEAQISEEYAAQARKDAPVLEAVKGMVSDSEFAEILQFLEDGGDNFQIINKPGGSPEDQGYSLGEVWIHQVAGICEDSYSGTVALPLPDGRYFQFSFAD